MRNSLKKFVKEIVSEEDLKFVKINETTKIDINIIRLLIVEAYKKYETYYEAESQILDSVFSVSGIENLNEGQQAAAEELAEKINGDILGEFYNILGYDLIADILYFLMKNKVKFFEKELEYKYEELNVDDGTLRCIAEEAKCNAVSDWLFDKDSNELEFYNRVINSLNESMAYHIN